MQSGEVKVKALAAVSVTLLAIVSAAVAPAASRSAAPPAVRLDPSFGSGGRALVPLGFEGPARWRAKMAASMPDGGLVLSNGHVLDRLAPEGRLDPSFGTLGTVVPAQPQGGSFEVTGIAVDTKGRIVVAGTSTLPPEAKPPPVAGFQSGPLAARVERYLADGSLDSSFGTNGIVESDFGLQPPRDQNGQPFLERPWVQATGVAVDPQNRIVVTGGAGAGLVFGCEHDWFFNTLTYAGLVARFTEAGTLDPGFGGGDGLVGGVKREENALAVEATADPVLGPGGQVTFRPGAGICPPPYRPGVAELDEAGSPQQGFGSGSRVAGEFLGVAPEPDGSLLVLEPRRTFGKPMRGVVRRLQPNGTPDPSFGRGGSTSLVVRGGRGTAFSGIAVDPAGRILVAGSIATEPMRGRRLRHRPPRQNWLLLERLTADGAPDPTVGPAGRATVRFKSLTVGPPTLLLDRQGRVLLVGRYRGRKRGVEGLAVARLAFTG
jgi:uncharacterized delta-60 repeat protein